MSTLPMTKRSAAEVASHKGDARPDWVPDELFPFASRFVDVDGACLHYVDEGSGPTILLVHGSPMWSFMYRSVIQKLRASFRCVAVDLPGLGLSKAPLIPGQAFSRNADWLQGFVKTLDLRDVTLVLHATGGPPALEVTIRERDRVRALVISNSFAWPLDESKKLETIVRIVSSKPFALANVHLNLLARLTARLGRRKGRFSDKERGAVLGPYREKATRRHLQNFLLGVRVERDFFASLEKRLGVLGELPVLFVYGVHDNGYVAGFLERWKSLLPRHEVVLLSESSHFPLEDEPEKFIEGMSSWLSRIVL